MVNWIQIGLDFVEFVLLVLSLVKNYAQTVIYKYILPVPVKSLQGKIILVTGSGRGIGREICIQLAECGAIVVCWSKSDKPNQIVREEIERRGGVAHCYTVDVSDQRQVQQAAALVRQQVGEVSMVINNAGMMKVKPFLETTASEIESLFKVNVFSNFWVLKEFLPAMIERGEGHLVSVCSASGLLGTRNIVPYSGTKHACHGVMEALRDELRHHPLKPNIKLTTAFPFYCSTAMLDDATPNTRFPYLIPIVTPEVVAQKLIKGIRQDAEYVYTPLLIGWLAMFSWLVPPKTLIGFYEFVGCNIDPGNTKGTGRKNGSLIELNISNVSIELKESGIY